MSGSCCSTPGSDASCATPDPAAERASCPTCGSHGPAVDDVTVAAMTSGPVAARQAFRLCRALGCAVVYYGDAGARFTTGDLHVVPGFKSSGPDGLVCYCFMHTRDEIERELADSGETTVPERITAQIKAGNCACEVRNPSGRCCLGEVNQAVIAARERLEAVAR